MNKITSTYLCKHGNKSNTIRNYCFADKCHVFTNTSYSSTNRILPELTEKKAKKRPTANKLTWQFHCIKVVDSGCLRGRGEKKEKGTSCMWGTKHCDAFMVKQLQSLVKLKVVLSWYSAVIITTQL